MAATGSSTPAVRDSPRVVYVAGDIHHEPGRSGAFPRWLDRLAALPVGHLVLLGDVFEYWLDTPAAAARHAAVLDRLRSLHRLGWRLDLVRGNRELCAGRLLPCVGRIAVHWPRLDLQVGGRRLRIVHGDRLCRDPGYHLFAAWLRSFWHRSWQHAHPAFLQDLVARALRARSRAKGRQRVRGAPASLLDARRVRAAGRDCDLLVAGHIHEAWRRRVGGIDLILVGDWGPEQGRWLELHPDGRIAARAERLA